MASLIQGCLTVAKLSWEIALTFEWLVFQIALGHQVETPKNDKGLKYKPMFEIESRKTICIAIYDGQFQPQTCTEAIVMHVETRYLQSKIVGEHKSSKAY